LPIPSCRGTWLLLGFGDASTGQLHWQRLRDFGTLVDMRWIAHLFSPHLVLTVALVSSIGVAWTAWLVLPERPLRECRLGGPFGLAHVDIDAQAKVALVRTTTAPMPASTWDQGIIYHYEPGFYPEHTRYVLDLVTGEWQMLGHERISTEGLSEYLETQRKSDVLRAEYDFAEPTVERWWMAWRHTDEEWTLHDADSKTLLASNRCDAKTVVGKPTYTADHRWITIGEDRPHSTDNVILGYLKRWLHVSVAESEDLHLLVYDAAVGQRINDVPSWSVARWTPDGNSFWTADTSYSISGNPNGVSVRLWSPHAAGPPLWLLSWTLVGGIGALPRSMWRSVIRRVRGLCAA
jgi:hypothetical protein